eukprot:TRINITY_DN2698_c0_g1_i3.p1 TRINITY_DN2698_c0_g1~~TRINITY_DN2698_c0_g1_i3.p1  ORF type:complete len:600 (+),score=136.61 TRINITY_DN2698_c0_g1_i3:37-1800(+)
MLYLGVIFFLIVSGLIFRFRIFTINDPASYLILFLLWGHVLIAFSFFLSVFFSKRKTATIVGYFMILGLALISGLLVDQLVANITTVDSKVRSAISIFPSFALYRGLVYLGAMVSWNGPGYTNSDLTDPAVNLGEIYGWFVGQWFVLMGLWWYLERVVPSGWGVKKHPLFFLGFGKHQRKFDEISEEIDPDEPSDVMNERKSIFKREVETLGICVKNLRKIYPSRDGNPPHLAVRGVTFGVEKNSCLGILGHNGAGKTTLIHMLIGLFEASSGTAYINGNNLSDDLDKIRTMMGICPQHDVLWDNLTAKEHLKFYGTIKNLKGSKLKEEIARVLKGVNLYSVRNKRAGKFSGGMKRRLSVAIAVLGNPKVIYLDEPSTGLDPKSRQELWQVINDAKQNASVILTTHSMEEADALCDRLMIMAKGSIKCIGVSADLKNRFGSGFKLSLQVQKGKSDVDADAFVRQLIPNVVLINELAGTRNYEVAKDSISLEKAFECFEREKERLHITDWAITNTTLEEVFLKISMADHDEKKPKEEMDKSPSKMSLITPNEIEMDSKQERKEESKEEKKESTSSEDSSSSTSSSAED